MNINPTPTVKIVDDHEISMAKSQVYRAAKCAMEIHKMLHQVDNLEGWMQSKITLAADYLESVSSNLEYDIVSAVMEPEVSMDTTVTMPMMTSPEMQSDLVETNAIDQAKQAGFAVGQTQIKNGKATNPHKPGTPEHRAWQQSHDQAKKMPAAGMQEAEIFPQLKSDVRQIGRTVGDAWKKYWHGTDEENAEAQSHMRSAWIRYFRKQKAQAGVQLTPQEMKSLSALADQMVAFNVQPPLMARMMPGKTD